MTDSADTVAAQGGFCGCGPVQAVVPRPFHRPIIRQHRETDYHGNFLAKQPTKRSTGSTGKTYTSAFDTAELYELTELGKQFVHYAMSDLPLKVEYHYAPERKSEANK